jgi:hypothetical protein
MRWVEVEVEFDLGSFEFIPDLSNYLQNKRKRNLFVISKSRVLLCIDKLVST